MQEKKYLFSFSGGGGRAVWGFRKKKITKIGALTLHLITKTGAETPHLSAKQAAGLWRAGVGWGGNTQKLEPIITL